MKTGGNSLSSGSDGSKRKVSYIFDPDVGFYYHGREYAMRPYRIRLTHDLVVAYGLHKEMEVVKPYPETDSDITQFQAEDYVAFLRAITPETMQRFNIGGYYPVFNELYQYCQTYAGGIIGCAVKVNYKQYYIAINWAGGNRHAKKCETSGLGYVNDMVLSILELLKHHKRVFYFDIDVHHGDGVEEEIFCTTDRVVTVSFHKSGDYFAGSGDIQNIIYGKGKYYSINVHLDDGIDDQSFQSLFKPIIERVMSVYDPETVVLQHGADSLAGDRLGRFNLSVKGHAECVRYMRSFNVPQNAPLWLLGGGGLAIRNVAKCWCHETGVAVGKEIDEKIPQHYEYDGPDYSPNVPYIMEIKNSKSKWDKLRSKVLENVDKMLSARTIQFQEPPPDTDFPKRRVFYVDIDDHHGDGVEEEVFCTTDRVMTVSFHKFGDSYFAGSDDIQNIGYGKGKYYNINVPLDDGIDDESFQSIFKPIIQRVTSVYDPETVVLQHGADSLAGDRPCLFNLSVKGHAECVRYMRPFNAPLWLLGGGGFAIRNVAKCWCHETGVAVDKEIDEEIPEHYEYDGPDYSPNVAPYIMENKKLKWDKIRSRVLENVNKMISARSIQFQELPPDTDFPKPEKEDYGASSTSPKWVGASSENDC